MEEGGDWGGTSARVAGANRRNWSDCADRGAGAAGIGCGARVVLPMQQFALPQPQPEQAGPPAAAGAACAPRTGALCAQTSVTLNRMASSRFTLTLEPV